MVLIQQQEAIPFFPPAVPCGFVHFKGEGDAVAAGITSHFKSKTSAAAHKS